MTAFGVMGALIILALSPVYLRRVLRGPTRPHPVSWGIWWVLAAIGAASDGAGGGGSAVIVLYAMVAIDGAIFIAALRVAEGRTSLWELWPLLPAAVGVAVWLGSQDPLAAAIGVVSADTCAFWPTLSKTWRAPGSEPALTWAVAGGAFALACASVPAITWSSLLYPVYLTVSSLLIAGIAWGRRERGPAVQLNPSG
jgi:hypothetical protein